MGEIYSHCKTTVALSFCTSYAFNEYLRAFAKKLLVCRARQTASMIKKWNENCEVVGLNTQVPEVPSEP